MLRGGDDYKLKSFLSEEQAHITRLLRKAIEDDLNIGDRENISLSKVFDVVCFVFLLALCCSLILIYN